MESDNGYFTAEQVDEQIDQLRQANTKDGLGDEAQLVKSLRLYHKTPLLAEDRAALEHARQRIAGTARDTGTFDDPVLVVTNPPARPVAHARGRRFMRLLSGLAAVVLVGILIGSWLVVTHMVATPTTFVPARPSDLYIIHSDIAYRLDGKSGKVIWQHTLPTTKQPGSGGSAYLQVVNHVVYAVLDFDIYALDAATGQQIWHVVNHTAKAYFWFVVDSGRLYLFSLDNTFSALNAAYGSLLWRNTTFTTENGYGFTVSNGNLYTQNSGGDQLDTLDGATGRLRWSLPLPQGSLIGAPLVENGVVYFTSGNMFYAAHELSGQRIWAQTLPGAGVLAGMYRVSGAGGILYVNSFSGIMESSTDIRNIFALDARTGKLLWSAGPGYNTLNLPVTNGLLLAAREHNGVYSLAGLDPRTGKATWQAPFQCGIYHFGPQLVYPECSALWTGVIDGKLYVLESNGQPVHKPVYTLKSFDPATGQLLSEHQLAIEQDNLVAVGADNGLLYLRISVPRFANTIYYDDYVFVALRLSDGATAWSHTMPAFPPPTSANTSPGTSTPVLAP
ncbi:MAG TPA: PQQ-binding-like beta-propeller repeat protein [Ktedonobacteraceae bacterium]